MELFDEVQFALKNLNGVACDTPLQLNKTISEQYGAQVFLKREDLQPVRSYKIRGAYNKISSLSVAEQKNGVVCASAGNHAQGVAYACQSLGVRSKIVMPATTPSQKIRQVRRFGKEKVEIILYGDTFDDACKEALLLSEKENSVFVHPFDDAAVIAGQGTIALEILTEIVGNKIDYLFIPVGGGGLAAGICTVFSRLSPETQLIGVEPLGAPSMKTAIATGINTGLETIDPFVDGAAVKKVGDLTFSICRNQLSDVVLVDEGKVCSTILQLYEENAIVVEPAGALTIAALEQYRDQILGKKVVCIVSGSNNDITRMEEMKERSLLYEGLKHYFLVNFPQRAGALRDFTEKVLSSGDDITYFQYIKKHHRETGHVIVGIETLHSEKRQVLESKMVESGFAFQYLNDQKDLFEMLVR